MSSKDQTEIVRALLEYRGLDVQQEVSLGAGLWKGIRADFVIRAKDIGRVAIECKWQTSRGSAEEKIAYLVYNALECYPIPCVILCSGSELEAAAAWARTKVGGNLLAVYDTDEFINWCGKLQPEFQ